MINKWQTGIAIGLVTFFLISTSQPSTKAAVQTPFNYVALGDSITFGYGLTSSTTQPSVQAYPFLAGTIAGANVFDEGISGLTSDGLIKLLQSGKIDSALQKAQRITVDIGSNDLLRTAVPYLLTEQTPPPSAFLEMQSAIVNYSTKLNEIIRLIKEQSKGQIVLLNLYNPLPPGAPLYTLGETEIGAMNRVLTHVAYAYQIPIVNVSDLFRGKEWLFVRLKEKDVHPNSIGQSEIAGSLLKVWANPKSFVPVAYSEVSKTVALMSKPVGGTKLGVIHKGAIIKVVSMGHSLWKLETLRTQNGAFKSLIGYGPASNLALPFYRYQQSADFYSVRTTGRDIGKMIVDQKTVSLTTPVLSANGQLYVPLIPSAHALGYALAWQQGLHSVWVTTNNNSTGITPTAATTPPLPVYTQKMQPLVFNYTGIGIYVDGARMVTPEIANEPFFYHHQVYVSASLLAQMFDVKTILAKDSLVIQRVPPLVNQKTILSLLKK